MLIKCKYNHWNPFACFYPVFVTMLESNFIDSSPYVRLAGNKLDFVCDYIWRTLKALGWKKSACTVHSGILNPGEAIFKQFIYNTEAVPSQLQENRVGESSIITWEDQYWYSVKRRS